ncbi:MAG TPA: ATP-binding protein [Acidobacteriota bacterium]|jgi:PAS domain S-box-containing protein
MSNRALDNQNSQSVATPSQEGRPRPLSVEQLETLFVLTNQTLAARSLDERLFLALDTLRADFHFSPAAVALIDQRRSLLRMRMAVGFPENSKVERLEMPLDSLAPGVSVVHEGKPSWYSRTPDQDGDPYSELLIPEKELLVLPLAGVGSGQLFAEKTRDDFDAKDIPQFWEPESKCVGALYVVTERQPAEESLVLLSRFAERVAVIIASGMHTDRLVTTVNKLQRERQWVESIMKSVADPIVLTNLDNEILLQNRRAEELFSGSVDASEGKKRALKMNDLLFSAYLSGEAVSSTEGVGCDLTLVDPLEGSDIHFEVISTPAFNTQGERVGLVSVFRDVTDLRRANEELAGNFSKLQTAEAEARRERDRLDLIIENVGQPVVVTDGGGNFILFNNRAELLFKQREASFPRALAAVQTNSVKLTSFLSGLASEMRTGRQAEIDLIDPETGAKLPMEITSVEVLDAKEQVTAVVSVLHDLSEIRELERRRVEQQLFESEKLAAVGRLAASIAHEVNNPLEAIKNSLFILKTGKDEAANARFMDIALKETERVSHVIRQMLGFARRSGGTEWVDVNQLLEETLVLVEKKLRQSNIVLTKDLDGNLPRVHAMPDQLRQVFLNLVINAQQAIERDGNITIKTKRHSPWVQPSISVEISDTGPGIPETDLERIFEPFFSTRKKGTGLGLWVTQDIISHHGGKIDVNSAEGKGTTFKIILPLESAVSEKEGKG